MTRFAVVLLAVGACRKDPPTDKSGPTSDPTEDTGTPTPTPTTPTPTCFTLADGSCVEETFHNPPVLQPDADGVYHLKLAATEVTLDGQRHCVRAYNGSYPGPTIDTPARIGNTPRSVRVNLVNGMHDHDYQDLDGQDCTCTDRVTSLTCLPEHVHDGCFTGEDTCLCTNADGDECHMADFNTTNLHAHGSHVRPDYARGGDACVTAMDGDTPVGCRDCSEDVCDGDPSDDTCFRGDDVLNSTHWGEGTQYRWDIDEDGTHHAGLDWYHPHIHGTTAIQVGSGAAGAWIIRGPIDALPGIVDARERVMVISTPVIAGDTAFQPLEEGVACTDDTLTFDSLATMDAVGFAQETFVNAEHIPRMVTAPGQVERWRIVHAGFLDEVWIGAFRGTDASCTAWSTADGDALPLTQIERDGIVLPQTYTDEALFLSPGYRIEALIGGEGALVDGETWCLLAARFLDSQADDYGGFGGQPMAPPVPPTRQDVFARFATDGDLIGILNVAASAGPATVTARPTDDAITALAPSLELGGVDIADRCTAAAAETDPTTFDEAAQLQVGFWTVDDPDPCGCDAFNVNCNNFESIDRSVYPVDRDLPLGAIEHWRLGASLDGHPFHIHINPFVVCPNDNVFDPLPFAHWRDTYLVNTDRQVDLVTQYERFTGKFVFHCHKLTHEDLGMMEIMRICDPATDPTCGDYAWRKCAPGDLQCIQSLAATDCALQAHNTLEAAACVTLLGGPGGVCGPNACAADAECSLADACVDNVCAPAPCGPPCGPRQTCTHGVCQ